MMIFNISVTINNTSSLLKNEGGVMFYGNIFLYCMMAKIKSIFASFIIKKLFDDENW